MNIVLLNYHSALALLICIIQHGYKNANFKSEKMGSPARLPVNHYNYNRENKYY